VLFRASATPAEATSAGIATASSITVSRPNFPMASPRAAGACSSWLCRMQTRSLQIRSAVLRLLELPFLVARCARVVLVQARRVGGFWLAPLTLVAGRLRLLPLLVALIVRIGWRHLVVIDQDLPLWVLLRWVHEPGVGIDVAPTQQDACG
jgi:hypothetical protein